MVFMFSLLPWTEASVDGYGCSETEENTTRKVHEVRVPALHSAPSRSLGMYLGACSM